MVGALNEDPPPPLPLSPLELVVGVLNEDPPPDAGPLDPLVPLPLVPLPLVPLPLVPLPLVPLPLVPLPLVPLPLVPPLPLAPATGMAGSASFKPAEPQSRNDRSRSRSTHCPRPCK